jgi:hypothetical protein
MDVIGGMGCLYRVAAGEVAFDYSIRTSGDLEAGTRHN